MPRPRFIPYRHGQHADHATAAGVEIGDYGHATSSTKLRAAHTKTMKTALIQPRQLRRGLISCHITGLFGLAELGEELFRCLECRRVLLAVSFRTQQYEGTVPGVRLDRVTAADAELA